MNALQTEYLKNRAAGMSATYALAAMTLWRTSAVIDLTFACDRLTVSSSIVGLCAELGAEVERIRMARRFSGARP